MTTSNVMGLGKVSIPMNGEMPDQKIEEASELVAGAFSNLMNQIQTNSPNIAETEKASFGLANNVADTRDKSEFDNYQFNEHPSEKIPKVSKEKPSDAELEEAKETLDEFGQAVVEKIADACGVEEEQVLEAMEALGLTLLDFMNPEQLAKVFVEVTGENESTLLVNDAFANLMADVNQMSKNLMAELGVKEKELEDVVSLLEELETPIELDMEFDEELAKAVEVIEEASAGREESVITETTSSQVETVVEEMIPVEKAQVEPKKVVVEDVDDTREALDQLVEETDEVVVKTMTEEKPSDSKNQNRERENQDGLVNVQVTTQEASGMSQVEHVESFTQNIDIMETIERLAENIRTTLSAETKTMEMQLNPEHLGKLYLQVSQKEGAVSASIVAQNEQVKDALLAQVATLQEKLNQAGVKVDAIEVTVGTHEFERNLEQDQKREEQNANAGGENRGRRNLNLNELDELSGLMTEEEALVAQIMRDNGNSVDLTA